MKDWGDIATIVTAVGTFSLAGVTWWMASKTKALAQETAKVAQETAALVAQEARHHKERFTPVCVLVPRIDGNRVPARLLNFKDAQDIQVMGEDRRENRFCEIPCLIQNVGVGPAMNVVMTLRFLGDKTQEAVFKLPPIGNGCTLDPALSVAGGFGFPVEMINGVFEKDDLVNAIMEGHWEIDLACTDVFGDTVHTLHSGDPEKPWGFFRRDIESP